MKFSREPIRNILTVAPLSALANLLLPPWVTVFMVHRVMPAESGVAGTTPTHLRNCLGYLRKHNYHLLSIEEAIEETLAGRPLPKKSVAFTVDDGFCDQVTTAAEVFFEFDCPATCFLVTRLVDGDIWPWDYQLMHIAKHAQPQTITIEIDGTTHSLKMGEAKTKQVLLKFARQYAPHSAYEITAMIAQAAGVDIPKAPPPEMQPATWDLVRAAEKIGMRFGAHSTHHSILSRLDNDTLRKEMTESVQRIQQECTKPSTVFCYPSGKVDEFDQRAMIIARELGLIGALTAEPGFIEPDKLRAFSRYRYTIPRLPLPDSMPEFQFYLSWAQYLREHFSNSVLKALYQ